ncbi:MAG: DUF362 domain-containing protein [Spirochaetia bacterium]
MTRREFLKAALASSFYFVSRRVFPAGLTAGSTDVGIATGADYAAAVTAALDLIGGMSAYVKPGHVVVVKPNIGWNSPPEWRATTDPGVVRTVVHLCFKAGAARVYVFDRSVSNPRLAYVTSGIQKAAEEAGARVLQVDDPADAKVYTRVTIPGATFITESLVNRYALECDTFVNVPVAKHHGEAGLTLGMKNLMGITGDQRGKWHWGLDEAIVDINRKVRSRLTLIDASTIMLRGGPTGGSPSYLKRLDTFLASSNVVSVDSEAAKLFGRTAAGLPYLVAAEKAGIGKTSGYSIQKTSV